MLRYEKQDLNPVNLSSESISPSPTPGPDSDLLKVHPFLNTSSSFSSPGRSLHDINGPPNPYIIALSLIARTLESFDDDHYIFGYGFGDTSTRADFVFSLLPNNQPIHGLDELLKTYRRMVPHVHLSGPTSFAPLIRQTMRHVYDTGMQFHILLIVADGQIHPSCLDDTKRAIVDASYFPISIVMVGVGDGPWNDMRKFDDQLPSRKWDNFQFVELQKIMEHPSMSAERREASFALNALMEVPHQYKIVQYLTGTNQRENVASIVEAIPPNLVLNPPVNTITSDMTLSFI